MGAEIPDGCVLVARAILNSSIWTMRAEDRLVAIACICLANWRPRSWFNGKEQITIERGQFVRSWEQLAEACRLSTQTVRTSVQHLEKVGFLTRKLTGPAQLFTIPKYDHYQDLTKYSDSIAIESNKVPNSPLTGLQQAINSDLTTNNKGIREEGNNGKRAIPEATALEMAKGKARLFEKEISQQATLKYIGYLENQKTIPGNRILDWVNTLWNFRESMVMNDGVPTDRLYCYAIDQAIEHKAERPSYVGKVMQNAMVKWREGALKF